jgi:hypothetical protein
MSLAEVGQTVVITVASYASVGRKHKQTSNDINDKTAPTDHLTSPPRKKKP